MNERDSDQCLSEANLRELIESSGEVENPEVEGHLESCQACRFRLDELAGRQQFETAMFPSTNVPPVEPLENLPEMIDHLKRQATQPAAPCISLDELSFLEPSSKPNVAGLLGHYEVLEIIAQGGMGIVLRAHDPKLEREVAIKVLSPTIAARPRSRQRFLREARSAAGLDHENILPVFSVDESKSLPYLIMPLVSGQSLEKRLQEAKGQPLPLHECLYIGARITRGLEHAHDQNLVHLDIKPANILLDAEGLRVWIMDFGLARAAQESTQTLTQAIAGTPQFMAPEQIEGASLDHRADLFSLGCVLYAMTTGNVPFTGDTVFSVMRSVREDQPSPAHEANPKTPLWLSHLIAQLLEKDPDKRLSSASEVATELERGSADSKGSRSKLAARLAMAAGFLGLGILAIGLVMAWQKHQRANPFRVVGKDAHPDIHAAIVAAKSGDVIEVRGRGSFNVPIERPIQLGSKALHIRAAKGAVPTLQSNLTRVPFFKTEAPLVLEGLILSQQDRRRSGNEPVPVVDSASHVLLSHCKVLRPGVTLRRPRVIRLSRSGTCELRNSEFYAPRSILVDVVDLPVAAQRSMIVHNVSVYCSRFLDSRVDEASSLSVEIDQSLFWIDRSFITSQSPTLKSTLSVVQHRSILVAADTIAGLLGLLIYDPSYLQTHARWQASQNVYAGFPHFVNSRGADPSDGKPVLTTFNEWKALWQSDESGSVVLPQFERDLAFERTWKPKDIEPDQHLKLSVEASHSSNLPAAGIDMDSLGPGAPRDTWLGSAAHATWQKRVQFYLSTP